MLWKTQQNTMVKKKNGKLTMRGFRPIAMLPTIYRLYSLQQLAGQTLQARRGLQHVHVPGRQAHEVVWMLKRVMEQATEWQIPVLDFDVAVVKLDDIVTPGIRRIRSVPQGDPVAADLLGTALDTPAACFCEMSDHSTST